MSFLQRPERRLLFLGFYGLFMELTLIRFMAGNIWNLGFFPNLVLLAVFLGLGFGFTFHRYLDEERSTRVFWGSAWLLMLLSIFVVALHPSVPGFAGWAGDTGGELFFTGRQAEATSLWPFLMWLALLVIHFGAVGQHTGKWFARFGPLRAYTLDIAGSCLGILTFMGISFLKLPAWSWFIGGTLIFALCLDKPGRKFWFWLPPLLATIAVAWYGDQKLLFAPTYKGEFGVRWSPYQKIEWVDNEKAHSIFVNGLLHQDVYTTAKLMDPKNPVPYILPHLERAREGKPPYKDVLVLGAGNSNDVCTALLNGAEHVDAVEIDPVIIELGKLMHPGKAYFDPRVQIYNGDGRTWMLQTNRKYDLIIFALTDSLVKVSPATQLRLENYLFSSESVARGFSLLKPDGRLLFYNSYRYPWLVHKLEQMIVKATGHQPRHLMGKSDFAMMVVGADSPPGQPDPTLDLPVDDWPFLYLKERGIPSGYQVSILVMSSLLLVLLIFLERSAGPQRAPLATRMAFFFMGSAFLLLESKSVIQFALLFGTTWLNNSLVFLAALTMVLAANWLATMLGTPGARGYGLLLVCLMAACLAPLVYPISNLLVVQNWLMRFLAASLLTFSPLFFGNLLFSLSFQKQPAAEEVFGWNLLGAYLGGMLEYTSMALGYAALAWIVVIFYALAALCLWKGMQSSREG